MEELLSALSLEGQSDIETNIADSKNAIREKVWSTLEAGKLIRKYPPSCHGKIPNFVDSHKAAKKVAKLREFRRAKVIKVNPSLAQMNLRLEILKARKTLVVPSPALSVYDEKLQNEDQPHFCYKINGRKLSHEEKKKAMTKRGAFQYGKPMLTDWSSCPHIDIVVVGAVAVTISGKLS